MLRGQTLGNGLQFEDLHFKRKGLELKVYMGSTVGFWEGAMLLSVLSMCCSTSEKSETKL